ncbi:MAG: sulfotransferase [Proteobacteria bacterium]|nr:sulfotransferase [Pseudomonadota bacterium]
MAGSIKDTPQDLFRSATAAHQAGQLDKAARLYRRILKVGRGYPDVLHLLGLAEHQLGNHAAAASLIREAIGLEAGQPAYHNNLASALVAVKDFAGAIESAKRALVLVPGYTQAQNNIASAHYWRARIAQDEHRYADAAADYRAALAIDPSLAEAHCNLCFVLTMMEDYTGAVTHGRAAISLRTGYTDAHNNLGYAEHMSGDLDAAEASYMRTLAIDPEYAPAHNNLGNIFKERGQQDRAADAFRRAIVCVPDFARAHFNLADVITFTPDSADLERLRAQASLIAARAPEQARYIHFAMGKALTDLGEPDAGFRHYLAGNALVRRMISYDEASVLKQMHDAPSQSVSGVGAPSDIPIFIVGMPRSGTTLVEQILASHPAVRGGGERRDFAAAIRACGLGDPRRLGETYLARLPALGAGQTRITDKLPANFLHARLIHAALPGARIIHVMRDPADTCVSNFSKLFDIGQEFTYDLGELGRYYVAYHRLMETWRRELPQRAFTDISYETLVGDLEGEARRLLEFCGLAWDPACLAFHKNARIVQTASATQVRKPLYRNAIGRANEVKAHIARLLTELAKL